MAAWRLICVAVNAANGMHGSCCGAAGGLGLAHDCDWHSIPSCDWVFMAVFCVIHARVYELCVELVVNTVCCSVQLHGGWRTLHMLACDMMMMMMIGQRWQRHRSRLRTTQLDR